MNTTTKRKVRRVHLENPTNSKTACGLSQYANKVTSVEASEWQKVNCLICKETQWWGMAIVEYPRASITQTTSG